MRATEQQASKSTNHAQNEPVIHQTYSYQCNRGITVLLGNSTRCLCPPSFYGSQCQFFSDRLTVITHLARKTLPASMLKITLKIRAHFIFNSNIIIDQHEFHLLPVLETSNIIKHQFYLLYSRSQSMLQHKRDRYFNRTDIMSDHPYAIHFILFDLQPNSRPQELGTWHYPIYFDYLPAHRLAIVLKYSQSSGNACQTNTCNNHSICLPIFNQNNSYYCSCRHGQYGVNCSLYEPSCSIHCAPNSLCRSNNVDRETNEIKAYCICPLDQFGPRCYLKYDQCDQNSCENNATCHSSFDPSGEKPFICICSSGFHGNRCQYEKAYVHVQLNITPISSARATVLQLYDILDPAFTLLIRHQKIYSSLPLNITYRCPRTLAPLLGILKIYQHASHPQYFFIYALNQSRINITSSPNGVHRPPHCYFQADTDRSVPSVFKYHRICQDNASHFCFYDENYFCLCRSNDSRAECFIHDPQLDHCDRCLADGKCLQGDPTDSDDFLCLCPPCHQGYQCEFNLEAFGSTFDSLLVRSATSVKILYLSIIVLLFIMGLITNFSSFVTFKRPKPRKFGTGTYLLIVTCLNQLALFFLLSKFVQITFGISSVLLCRLVSYLLPVFTRSTYWLTSWIAVDRILITLFPSSFRLKNTRLAIRLTIITLIIVLAMHIHEAIFHITIQNQPTGFPMCVSDFGSDFVAVYNRVSTPIHYILPFLIQTTSITLLIIFATRSRIRATTQKNNFYQALKTQFQNQKELYITPTLVIFSISPQVIVTFSFVCIDLSQGQRHLLLCVYLLSYAPQVLGFILYVLPSSSYKKEFGETSIGKKFFQWMLKK